MFGLAIAILIGCWWLSSAITDVADQLSDINENIERTFPEEG
jgi:hypothetical protein